MSTTPSKRLIPRHPNHSPIYNIVHSVTQFLNDVDRSMHTDHIHTRQLFSLPMLRSGDMIRTRKQVTLQAALVIRCRHRAPL